MYQIEDNKNLYQGMGVLVYELNNLLIAVNLALYPHPKKITEQEQLEFLEMFARTNGQFIKKQQKKIVEKLNQNIYDNLDDIICFRNKLCHSSLLTDSSHFPSLDKNKNYLIYIDKKSNEIKAEEVRVFEEEITKIRNKIATTFEEVQKILINSNKGVKKRGVNFK
ncbi:MAG: hypothetical protein FWC11_06725 [Firmicutes bacterium]|nr:hypothetical protein [Bacillota bacterium]